MKIATAILHKFIKDGFDIEAINKNSWKRRKIAIYQELRLEMQLLELLEKLYNKKKEYKIMSAIQSPNYF